MTARTNEVLRITNTISALIKAKNLGKKVPAQLTRCCSRVRQTFENGIRGKSGDDPCESDKELDDLERILCEIVRILEGTGARHPERNKEVEIESHVLKIQHIVDTFQARGSSLDRGPHTIPTVPQEVATTCVSESACRRLVRRAFSQHELPSLIEGILSSRDETEKIHQLSVDDAQTLIDIVDEALHTPKFSPRAQKKCLKLLYRTCGRHALLPKALEVPVSNSQKVLKRGGFADVSKGESRGRDVAVKVIRTYSDEELRKVINRFCKEVVMWKFLDHPNVLPLLGVSMSENRFAMVSEWMENGNINEFVKAHPDTDKLGLLADVAEGLIYIHSNGMIHGDLKGANILIDGFNHARLADFGLLTIMSDPTSRLSSSSYTQGGTARWMGPELIAPQKFGSKKSRPTESSDCYALAMVVYEIIGERVPFYEDADLTVFLKVMGGEHPTRGKKFPDRLWKTLKLCWISHPKDRPSINDVLGCLRAVSSLSELPSLGSDEEMEGDGDDQDSSDGYSTIQDGASTISTLSSFADAADYGLTPTSPLSPLPNVGTNSGVGVGDLGYETDPDPLTPPMHPNILRALPMVVEEFHHSPEAHLHHDTSQVQSYPFHALLTKWDQGRTLIPQLPHTPDVVPKGWVPKPSIDFSVGGHPGVRLSDAVRRNYRGMDGPGDYPFDEDTRRITIRVHFPGYYSSTKIHESKGWANFMGGRTEGGSMQVTTWSVKAFDGPITKGRLLRRIAKRIKGHMNDLESGSGIVPFDDRVGGKWRLGQGAMKFEHMVITQLSNVSESSWSPTIYLQH